MKISRRDKERYKTSGWDNLSFMEHICFILLPLTMVFIFYMIMDSFGLHWGIRIPIAISVTTLIIVLLNWWAKWMADECN